MIKLLYEIVKRFILAVLLIYAYNKLALPLNLVIPINIITIGFVGIFGVPSILMFILFSLVCI